MSPRITRAWALVLLAAIPVLGSWPEASGWLIADPVYTTSRLGTDFVAAPLPGRVSQDPNDGTTTEALGRLAASEWLHGRVPWWNPYDGVGLPLAAEGANQALFLPFVLLFALRNGSLWLLLVLQEITAFATYALLRRMALAPLAAWTGAALYAIAPQRPGQRDQLHDINELFRAAARPGTPGQREGSTCLGGGARRGHPGRPVEWTGRFLPQPRGPGNGRARHPGPRRCNGPPLPGRPDPDRREVRRRAPRRR
jgi:hypothetical protein